MATPVPVLRILNPQAPGDRQQAVAVPSKEARLYRDKGKAFSTPPVELLSEATAMAKAEKLLRAKGTPRPSRQQCLGKLVLPFGKYLNAPFHWLVANDVGYIKFTAGTKSLKGRRDMIAPLSHPQTSLPPVSLPRPRPPTPTPAPAPAPRPLPSPSPSTATRAIAGPSTRPIVHAIAGRPILPATSTIARPVPSLFPGPILPASQPTPAIAGPSSMPLLPAIQATPSANVSVPPTIECIPSSWARSTLYKRKGVDEPSGVGAKVSRVQKLPSCTCCGQPTQGHKKYRRKVFCPVKMMSPSKGLEKNTVYNSYQHFTAVVDALEQ
ncbi:hypothetical protein NQZ68_036324 [Dissostichus eleginoides]|nr:hypothetical protein NQZ68_036324 [Dissostichus eleginoides]